LSAEVAVAHHRGGRVLRQSAGNLPAAIPEEVPMKVSYPPSQPAGFHPENGAPMPVLSYSGFQNPSLRGKTYVGTGAVLFRFFDFSDPVLITIDLRAAGGIATLADADLDVPAKSPARFVLFEGFPLGTARDPRFYPYELWLVNKKDPDKAASAKVDVLYRTR
jgi:hypothetical protein